MNEIKKKWYRNNFVKAALIVIELMLFAAACVCVGVFAGMYSNKVPGDSSVYALSRKFADEVFAEASHEILDEINYEMRYAKLREQGESAVVDLQEISEKASGDVSDILDHLTWKNVSGLAYSVEDLKKWAASGWDFEEYSEDGGIIVCVKSNGTYEYYYYNDFVRKINSGELKLQIDPSYLGGYAGTEADVLQQFLDHLKYGEPEGNMDEYGIQYVTGSKNNAVEFTNVYRYPRMLEEEYVPDGASDILEVVNTNPEWNGRLSEAYSALELAFLIIRESENQVYQHYQEGNTNLTYLYADIDNRKVYTNKSSYSSYAGYEDTLKEMKSEGAYLLIKPQLADCETNLAGMEREVRTFSYMPLQTWYHILMENCLSRDYVFAVQVDTEFSVADSFAENRYYYEKYSKWNSRFALLAGIAIGVFLLAGIVWLTIIAGKRPENEEIHLCAFDHLFTEIAAVLVFAVWVSPLFGGFRLFSEETILNEAVLGGIGCYTGALFLTGYLSLVRRIKAKSLWKDSILRYILILVKKLCKKITGLAEIYSRNTGSKIKITLMGAGFMLLQFVLVLMLYQEPAVIILLCAADGAAMLYLLLKADGSERILEGLKRISGGELQYKIPLERLRGEQKVMAEYINNIGSGLDAAVENSLKSERMKTELITNVSHDIKTPLTSIINYVDLLKREQFEDPKICGYIEVLEQKAQRLKVLTEDVVEASKASTGNITLEMADLDFVEMVHQVIGEFEERFRERNLTMMVHFTDEPSVIYADGQRMWRVLENIFNNVVKYAMEGTRVYAEIVNKQKKVIFTLKNISQQPLNISADELTERFIRGDVSRNTEGSGLGLSIAKSLTELQGGELNLHLDGDLFKVVITFMAR